MATKNIKGITIEFDAKTDKLSLGLREINKEIKNVDAELKKVDQALKLDPGNAEQVARKMDLLAEKSAIAEKKVDALKAVQKELDGAGVDKNSKAYQQLTTEIAKAEAQQKQLAVQMERTAKSFDEVTQGSKQLENFLKVTGQTADDLTSIIGSKLVDAYKSGSLGAAGYQVALEKVCQATTGSKKDFEEFKKILSSVDDDADFSKINNELQALSEKAGKSKTDINALGVEFAELSNKTGAIEKELKAVNESLKLDPGNIELAAQKQDLLSQAVGTTEEKLQNLKQRYNDFKSGNLDLGEEEFRLIQREISNTESELNKYETELSDLENAQQRLNTYFEATGKQARDFSNILGSELVGKIERGQATSVELAHAIDKIGTSAGGARSDVGRFKSELDGIHSDGDIGKLSAEFKQAGDAAEEAQTGIGDLAEKLDELNQKVEDSNLMQLSDALEPVTDGLKEIGSTALEASGDMTNATNNIKISLGETSDQAEATAEHARNAWANNFGGSLDEATDAVIQLKQSLGDLVNDNNVEDLTEKILTLSDVCDVDVNESIRAVKSVTEAWGISGEEALDGIYWGIQNGLDISKEWADNIAEYAPLLKDSGYSWQEMCEIASAGMEAGAYSTDKVLDLVKEIGIRVADGTIKKGCEEMGGGFQQVYEEMEANGATAREIFPAIVDEIEKLGSEQEKATAITTIFGTLGEDAGVKVVEAMGNAKMGIQDFAGTADEAVANNSNSVEQMARSWENFRLALAPLGEQLAKIATTILDAVTPIIEGISKGFDNLPGPIKTFIAAFGGVAVVFATLMPIISGVIGAFSAISAALGAAGLSFAAVAGPIGIAIAAIAAVIAIITNWDSICEWFSGVWENFSSGIGEAWENLCNGIGEWWQNAWGSVKDAWNGFWDSIISGLEGFGTAIGEGVEMIKNAIAEKWQAMCDGLSEWWNNTWAAITGFFSGAGAEINTAWNNFTDGLKNAWNACCDAIGKIWSTITTALSDGFNAIKQTCSDIWNAFTGAIQNAWNDCTSKIKSIWDSTKENLGNAFENAKTNISNIWNGLKDNLTKTWETAKSILSQTTQAIKDDLSKLWDGIKENINACIDNIKNTLSNAWDSIKSTAQNAWDGIKNTLSQAWENIKTNASTTFDNIKSTVSTAWDNLKSNSETAWDGIKNTLINIWDNLKSNASTKFDDLKSTIGNIWDNLKNNSSESWDRIREKIMETIQNILDNSRNNLGNLPETFRNVFDNAKNIVSNAVQSFKNLFNFNWELPKIKLPHFGISGNFSLVPPSVPTFSVSWYKKGGILTAPTIFGASGASLLGGGEAGHEAVLPLDSFYNTLGEKLEDSNKELIDEQKAGNQLLRQLIETLANNQNTQIVLDSGALVGNLTPKINNSLGREFNKKVRQ